MLYPNLSNLSIRPKTFVALLNFYIIPHSLYIGLQKLFVSSLLPSYLRLLHSLLFSLFFCSSHSSARRRQSIIFSRQPPYGNNARTVVRLAISSVSLPWPHSIGNAYTIHSVMAHNAAIWQYCKPCNDDALLVLPISHYLEPSGDIKPSFIALGISQIKREMKKKRRKLLSEQGMTIGGCR